MALLGGVIFEAEPGSVGAAPTEGVAVETPAAPASADIEVHADVAPPAAALPSAPTGPAGLPRPE